VEIGGEKIESKSANGWTKEYIVRHLQPLMFVFNRHSSSSTSIFLRTPLLLIRRNIMGSPIGRKLWRFDVRIHWGGKEGFLLLFVMPSSL